MKPKKLTSYCPLCGEEIIDIGVAEHEEDRAIHFFSCENHDHSVPYVIAQQSLIINKKEDYKVFVAASTGQTVMRGKKEYCFLCSSELRAMLKYFDGTNDAITHYLYECGRGGHIWYISDYLQCIVFSFVGLGEFDRLLLSCGTVSHHHIVLPAHEHKREKQRRLLTFK